MSRDALSEVADAIGLSRFLLLGDGEMRSGGSRRPSILGDALEALLGAVFVDGGWEAAEAAAAHLFAERMNGLGSGVVRKDPKTTLQEILQARRLPLPEYRVVETSGEAHAQVFLVECRLASDGRTTVGRGSSRRAAEQVAAELMCAAVGADEGVR